MTEQADTPAVPVQATSQAGKQETDVQRVNRLRQELAAAQAKLPIPVGTVRLKVEAPHSSFQFGAHTVGAEWTEIPGHAVPNLFAHASDAGVTLTQEG